MTKAQASAFDQVLYQFDELTVKVYRNRRKVEQVVERLEHPKSQECEPEHQKRQKKEETR